MALVKELEDELMCPIDLEYFEDPMVLKCLHDLCRKDVDEMIDVDGLLQCPLCNKISERKDIKPDFRIRTIIELLKADKDRLKGKQVCEFCEDEPATNRCQQCAMFIGENCLRGHQKAPTTQSHTFNTTENIKENNKGKIGEFLNNIDQTIVLLMEMKNSWVARKTQTQKQSAAVSEAIHQSEQDIIKAVSEKHAQLRDTLKIETENENQNCNTMIQLFDRQISSVNKDKHLLKDILAKDDGKTLLNNATITSLLGDIETRRQDVNGKESGAKQTEALSLILSSHDNVLDELNKLQFQRQSESSDDDTAESSGVFLATPQLPPRRLSEPAITPDQIDAGGNENAVRPKAKHGSDSGVSSISSPSKPVVPVKKWLKKISSAASNVMNSGLNNSASAVPTPIFRTTVVLTSLSKRPLTVLKQHTYDVKPLRITAIGDQLWTVREDADIDILMCTANGDVRHLANLTICDARDTCVEYVSRNVAQRESGLIVAACEGVKVKYQPMSHRQLGLVVVDSSGQIADVITEGKYFDVKTDKRYIYGLASPGDRVTMHNKPHQKWVAVRDIKLQDNYGRMCVRFNVLTLSNAAHHILTKYDLHTNQQTRHGKEGAKIGEVRCPSVSVSDSDGNVLFCDYANQRLQILTRDDKFQLLDVKDPLDNPWDATVDCYGHLYVIKWFDQSLVCLK